ncbi:response regulator [Umezawaea endophytica]|uniref:Response regulator n=1 Tax=Umezawaea endophytica TaxID=1654476 RepID=A0A9X2VQ88_9PSEU|nr:response regulator [Umezawaea endophytica]MCS7480339.1 response regulator [Umezawaea endophytica]
MKTLLVVDDDPDVLEVLSLSLGFRDGWLVETAGGGEEALRRCLTGGVDAVLLDVEMPGLDGRRTLRALREAAQLGALPVVFITAAPDLESELRELGALAVLSKPFDPLRIADDLALVLDWVA